VANPKLSTLADPFTASSINTSLWNSVTGGAATLDAVNDLVALASPTVSGTNNSFGSSALWDATSSAIYAEIGTVPNGNGGTKTIFKLTLDANNSVAIRLEAGVFKFTLQTAGTTVTTTLPAYDPNAHGWWRLREASGTWYAETSADGYNWTTLTSSTYSWSATALSFGFQTGASVTEVAGNVATIQHVNTMLGGPFNINWPTIEDAWAPFWNANAGDLPLDRYVEITDRTRGTANTSRGRQYETDQVRSGEASLTLANTDGALDPVNASGPWYGHIAPYQPYRKRAQWPPTRNLLDQVAATGGDVGGYALGAIPTGNAGADIFSSTDSSGGSFVASASAWAGATVMQFSVPSGSVSTSKILYTMRTAAVPGQRYSVSLQGRNVTASSSLQVWPFLATYNAAGTLLTLTTGATYTLTGGAAPAWTSMWATAVTDATTAYLQCGLMVASTAAATVSVQADGWQLEKIATASFSAWTCPGLWNPVYAGFMERWSSSWNMSGTYGLVSPSVVDAFSLLSQKQLSDPLTQEINNNSPRFLFKLDDPSGSTSVADATGTYPAAQLAVSKYGAGSLTFGTTITATDATGVYTGSSGTVATVNNPNPGTNTTSAATFIKLGSAGILGPATTIWTRALAFRYTGPTPSGSAVLWSSFDNQRAFGIPSGSNLILSIGSTGYVAWASAGPTGTSGSRVASTINVCDGDWHLVVFGFDPAATNSFIALDGVVYSYISAANTAPSGLISDNIGSYVDPTIGNGTILNFKGDISFAAEFPSLLSATAVSNMYAAWRSACSGESTAARYSRILRYSGYNGPSSVQTGLTTSMGPASIDGQDTVSALQAVVDTEGGAHYVDRAGTVTFRSRSARYNATTPAYTFGENAASGEWPYEDVALDYDSTHLSNQVTVTQESTSQAFYANDATSIANYFPRTMSRTVNSSSAFECQDAATYLLSRYKNPATRVSSIKLHPSANPALWPVCLALELGTRVRVMRRAPNLPVTQIECFVENIAWDFGDNGEAFQTLQCSPVDLTPYGVFSSWHTTLKVAISAGATSITINPSQDNTNVLVSQLAVGEVLTLDPGTSLSENVTVTAVGATSTGWTSAVLTISAAANAHAIGAVVCDQLPTGTTDPTTWDAVSMFDSTAFAY
jgi:hypothetical protein